jgi:hypothetical protein
MPDRRKHRGKHPQDDELFADEQLPRLREAVANHSWLLTRQYSMDASLKLVGDRFGLTVRQRLAVRRCSCSDDALRAREATRKATAFVGGRRLGIDGYNLLITIESALSGGVLLGGRDGCLRDLASIHGTYRHVEETIPALNLIIEHIESLKPAHVDWYLDRPVSNSGRLKRLIAELLKVRSTQSDGAPSQPPQTISNPKRHTRIVTDWNIELVDSPDRALTVSTGVVVSSDSVVLDRCGCWANVAQEIIEHRVPDAWLRDLARLD